MDDENIEVGNMKKVKIIWNRFLEERWKPFYYSMKRWWKIQWNKFLQWGHQKLTVMFIPHSEQKVLTIHISNFTMMFVLLILAITVSTSVIAISGKKSADQKVMRLENQTQIQAEQIREFIRNVRSLKERFASFRTDIKGIYKTIGGKFDALYDQQDVNEIQEYLWETTNGIYPNEVTELKKIESELELYKRNIQELSAYLKNVKNTIINIPSIKPTFGWITSHFGYRRDPLTAGLSFHYGLDIANLPGTPVMAAAQGRVVEAGWKGGYGLVVRIRHKYGFETVYAHLRQILVYEGQKVERGQIIGRIGSTGRATGSHLHFEVRIGGVRVDPLPFILINF